MVDWAAKRLFATTVELYRRYRPRYPRPFVEALAAELALGPEDTVLDLGCGPGFLAVALRPFTGRMIGMDPEPLMLEAMIEEAAAAGVMVEALQGSSATLPQGLSDLKAVVMGRSFHWMDRSATLRLLEPMLAASGAIALCRSRPEPTTWSSVLEEIRHEFEKDMEHPSRVPRRDDRAILLESPLPALKEIEVPARQELDLEGIIGQSLTRSATSPGRLGARRPAFEQAIREGLAPYLKNGVLTSTLTFTALIARRA